MWVKNERGMYLVRRLKVNILKKDTVSGVLYLQVTVANDVRIGLENGWISSINRTHMKNLF